MIVNPACALTALQALALLLAQSEQLYDKAELNRYQIAYLDEENGAYLAINGDNYSYGYLMSMWRSDTGEVNAFGAKILDCSDKILRCKDIGLVKIVRQDKPKADQFRFGGFSFSRQIRADGIHYRAVCGDGPCPSTAAAGISLVQNYDYVLDTQGNVISLHISYMPDKNGIAKKIFLKKMSCGALPV
ncbi:MAG TPA: hypothetical protein VF485_11830 [Sphingomonas sp.]